jgi:hypothetical protein
LHVGAHHALTSLFTSSGEKSAARIYCYSIKQEEDQHHHTGRLRLAIGRLHVRSNITLEEAALSYGALHLGDHNVTAGVLPGLVDVVNLSAALLPPFARGDLTELLRAFDQLFSGHAYSLRHLFRDEQRSIVAIILEKTLRSVGTAFQHLYENHAPLMRFLSDLGVPQPGALLSAADYALHQSLRAALAAPVLDGPHIVRLLDEAARAGVRLDEQALGFALKAAIERLLGRIEQHPGEPKLLGELLSAVELGTAPPFSVNLWKAENAYAELLEGIYPTLRQRARTDGAAAEWLRLFIDLGQHLRVRIPDSD